MTIMTIKKIGIALLGFAPLLALAQPVVPVASTLTTYSGIINIINTAASWLLGILLALAVAFFIWAGILYLTSQGNEDKVKEAKSLIIYGIIGIIVGLVAKAAILLIQNFLGTNVQP